MCFKGSGARRLVGELEARKQNETRAGDPVNGCGKAAQIKEYIGMEFWITLES